MITFGSTMFRFLTNLTNNRLLVVVAAGKTTTTFTPPSFEIHLDLDRCKFGADFVQHLQKLVGLDFQVDGEISSPL